MWGPGGETDQIETWRGWDLDIAREEWFGLGNKACVEQLGWPRAEWILAEGVA